MGIRQLVTVAASELIEETCSGKMDVPEYTNTRELIHLHDSHKFVLYKNLRFLEKYTEFKVQQNWSRIYNTTTTFKSEQSNDMRGLRIKVSVQYFQAMIEQH